MSAPSGDRVHSVTYYLPTDTGVSWYGFLNPEGLTGINSSGGRPNEPYSIRAMSYAASYLATGWGTYARVVNHMASVGFNSKTTRATAIGTSNIGWIFQSPRANVGTTGAHFALAATLIDATAQTTNSTGYAPRTPNYTVEMDWLLDAYEENELDLGDYRDGVVGMNKNYDDTTPGFDISEFPNFQLFVVADFLIDYYNNWQADSRIPAMLQTLADATLANSATLTSGQTGFGWTGVTIGQSYKMGNTALEDTPRAYYHGYMSRLFAWVAADTSDPTYSDAWTSSAQLEIPSNDSKAIKQFGEYFGSHSDAVYYLTEGVFSGPVTPREPTIYGSGA
jgi:hypothetical protein